jgi:hypothetical protein
MNASSGPPRCLFDGMTRSSAMGGRLRHAAQLDSSLASAMLTGRPERRTLRVQVPVRELEARRRKGSRAVRGRYSIMRLSIAPRVPSRSRSREPGSLAGTPKPKHHASPPSKLAPCRSGSWGRSVHSVSSARLVSSGARPTSAPRGTDGPVHTSAITAWSNVMDSIAWLKNGYAQRAILRGL